MSITDWRNFPLPAGGILDELAAALRTKRFAVLTAAPGAGKTTLVPPAMLDMLYGGKGRIVMLEPRRIAARAAAERIAAMLGEKVGKRVGYRMRGDSCVGRECVIEVITEGLLTGMLQRDPELAGVSLLIFDEFHERSLHSDLGLALALDAAENLRPDLHILIMSATLDSCRISAMLGEAPVISSPDRMFPVTVHFGGASGDIRSLPERMANAIGNIVGVEHGSILAFLPGAGEIERTYELLAAVRALPFVDVVRLYGALDRDEQFAAIAPPAANRRKIVLATNIAESSITIEGVRVVVDSGYERRMRFNPATAMPQLDAVRISRASATQRAGRAGRLEPGAVYRLWSESEDRLLVENIIPEILECDLAPLALELAQWGCRSDDLRWLDPPPPPQLAVAYALLRQLGALSADGRLTPGGRRLAQLPVHPRQGALLLKAQEMDIVPLGCELAALLEERDIMPGNGAEIGKRLEVWRARKKSFYRLNVICEQLLRLLHCPYRECDDAPSGILLAAAYPERICKSRALPGVEYLTSGGRGGRLGENDDLRRCEYLVAPVMDGAGASAAIRMAAPLAYDDILRHCSAAIEEKHEIYFDRDKRRVCGYRCQMLGALKLRSEIMTSLPSEAVVRMLGEALAEYGLAVLDWSEAVWSLVRRVRYAKRLQPDDFPEWSDTELAAMLPGLLPEARSFDALRKGDWRTILEGQLSYAQMRLLNEIVPERFTVPTGSKIRIDYEADPPVLAVRVQELYGVTEHPSLGRQHLPLKLELLSPAQRTIQITMDLPLFWKTNWQLVRKDMRSQYPKHVWPEDPAAAAPTLRAKPRKEQAKQSKG